MSDLFDYDPPARYPDAPGYKDGDTSRAAADSMAETAPMLRDRCHRALKALGASTADEIAMSLDLSVLAVRPRFTELLKAERIADTGQRRQNASGRMAKVWRAL